MVKTPVTLHWDRPFQCSLFPCLYEAVGPGREGEGSARVCWLSRFSLIPHASARWGMRAAKRGQGLAAVHTVPQRRSAGGERRRPELHSILYDRKLYSTTV